MPVDVPDPAVASAVTRAVGHGPPFDPAEIAAVDALDIAHARSLAGLEGCRDLAVLTLVGCETGDYTPLRRCAALRVLRVDHSDLRDAGFLGGLSLLDVRLLGCRVADVTLPGSVLDADLRGNPLSDESVAALREHDAAVLTDGEGVRDLNDRLASAGIPLALYEDAGDTWLAPVGLSVTPWPEAGHLRVEPDTLRAVLDGGDDPVEFYERHRPRWR